MSGLCGGAVRVYLNEEGVTLQALAADVERMVESFADRILAARMAARCVEWLGDQIDAGTSSSAVVGLQESGLVVHPLRAAEELADPEHRRPLDQWWMRLRPTVDMLASRLATTDG